MKKFVRYNNQIISVEGNYDPNVCGAFCWKDDEGRPMATIKQWAYNSESEALGEFIEDLDDDLIRLKERLYEIEGFE